MSQHPTCPKHMVLKPCPHCEPSKFGEDKVIKLCADAYKGSMLVKCACGKYRPEWRACGASISY